MEAVGLLAALGLFVLAPLALTIGRGPSSLSVWAPLRGLLSGGRTDGRTRNKIGFCFAPPQLPVPKGRRRLQESEIDAEESERDRDAATNARTTFD